MGFQISIVKLLLIIVNVIISVIGVALLSLGIWLHVHRLVAPYIAIYGALEFSGELIKFTTIMVITLGIYLLVIGVYGCFGAITENSFILGVYIIVQVLITVLDFTAGIRILMYKAMFLCQVDGELRKAFVSSNTTSEQGKAFANSLHFAEAKMHCCGIAGPQDYVSKSLTYPPTCCVLKGVSLSKSVDSLNDLDVWNYTACKTELAMLNISWAAATRSHPIGCQDKLTGWATSQLTSITGVAVFVTYLELFGCLFACFLCKSIWMKDRVEVIQIHPQAGPSRQATPPVSSQKRNNPLFAWHA